MRALCPARDGQPTLRYISLGAGVQSTAMLLLADRREIGPRPDFAVFADTGWEPAVVYDHLDKLEADVSIPIVRVSAGNLADQVLGSQTGARFSSVPFHVANERGEQSMLMRNCTRDFKIIPIERAVREHLGLKKHQRATSVLGPNGYVESWQGITLDESVRMKPASTAWVESRYPLVELLRWTRHDCRVWLESAGFADVPKSACLGCPYHSNSFWRWLRDHSPDEWNDTVAFDCAIREAPLRGVLGTPYLHRSLVPLSEVDLSTDEELGQMSMFANECEGMCGL